MRGRRDSTRASGFKAVMEDRDRSAADVDFFPTRPWGARAGAELIKRLDPQARTAWECACGPGHMAHGLRDYFEHLWTSDLCLYDGNAVFDFVAGGEPPIEADWIITNPPFEPMDDFIRLAYGRAKRGVAMLLRGACLEGDERYRLLYEDCPYSVYAPFSQRLPMHKGFWDPTRSTATFYAWFIWLKPGVGPRIPVILGERRPLIIAIKPGTRERLTKPEDAVLFAAKEAA